MVDFIFLNRSNYRQCEMAAPVVHFIRKCQHFVPDYSRRSDLMNMETTNVWATWKKSAGIEMSQ